MMTLLQSPTACTDCHATKEGCANRVTNSGRTCCLECSHPVKERS